MIRSKKKPNVRITAVHKQSKKQEHVASGWWDGTHGNVLIEGPYEGHGEYRRTGAQLCLVSGEEISTGRDGEWFLRLEIDR